MKRIATALSAFLGLLALTSAATAQFGPTPDITSIPQRQANSPGNIVINGSNLGLVTDVKIDGVPVPIIRTRTDRIIVGPLAPQLAHFAAVRVSGGNSSDTGTLSLLPTLSATRRGFAVFPSIHNGDTGTYILRYTYQSDLVSIEDKGIYGRRFLSPFATVSSVGVFPDANPFSVAPFALPIQIGTIGENLKMQAECSATTSGLVRYTNLAEVVGFGNPFP
jgi:hypothetical protein